MMKRISVTVKGRVQGVGYRYYVRDSASGYGITGYVKNNPDGTVSVVAEGEQSSLKDFIEDLRASGDRYITVDDISVTWDEARRQFGDFYIRW